MILRKKKICSVCGKETYIFSKGRCEGCAKKEGKSSIKSTSPPKIEYQGLMMPIHTALYYSTLRFDTNEGLLSEISGKVAVDIHHIIRRGLIGKHADHILNLMAVTREEHELYGDKKDYIESLVLFHYNFLVRRGVDKDYIESLIRSLPEQLELIKQIYLNIAKNI